MCRKPIATVAVGVLAYIAIPAQTQETQGVVFDKREQIERPYTRLRGDAIPTYAVVETFFRITSAWLERPPERRAVFLESLGILPGSRAEDVLREAVYEARSLVLAETPTSTAPALTEPAERLARKQVEDARMRVAALASIHATLLFQLEVSGYDTVRLAAYLDDEVRAGMVVTMYPHPADAFDVDAAVLEIQHRFDNLLVDALVDLAVRLTNGSDQ